MSLISLPFFIQAFNYPLGVIYHLTVISHCFRIALSCVELEAIQLSWNSSLTILRWMFLSLIVVVVTLTKLFNLKFPLDLMIFWISRYLLSLAVLPVIGLYSKFLLSGNHSFIHSFNRYSMRAYLLISQALLLVSYHCWL